MKRFMPDYAKKSNTNLASNDRATISETGFAYISMRGYSTTGPYETHLYVNSKEINYWIIEGIGYSDARALYTGFVIPVTKGDVITATRGLDTVNFIPGKWV